MIDKKYKPTPVVGPLDSVHLWTRNNAHLHADRGSSTISFHVSMKHNSGEDNSSWYFNSGACEEAIEFFGILRDELLKEEEG